MRLLLLLLLIFAAPSAFACTCPEGGDSVEQSFDAADLVFTGEAKRLAAGYFEDGAHATLFTPQHVFKGIGGHIAEIPIATEDDGQNCDLLFWEKHNYLVYAKLDGHLRYRATICSRTTFLEGAGEEVSALKALESDLLRQVPSNLEKQLHLPTAGH